MHVEQISSTQPTEEEVPTNQPDATSDNEATPNNAGALTGTQPDMSAADDKAEDASRADISVSAMAGQSEESSDAQASQEEETPASPFATAITPTPTDPPHIVELKAAIIAGLANPEFVKDIKRVEKAKDTFKMPDEEARVRAQHKVHAEKKLRAEAAVKAEETGVYVAPTQVEIDTHIERGLKAWRAKHKK